MSSVYTESALFSFNLLLSHFSHNGKEYLWEDVDHTKFSLMIHRVGYRLAFRLVCMLYAHLQQRAMKVK